MLRFIGFNGHIGAKSRWFLVFLAFAFAMPIVASEPVYAESFFKRLFKGFKKKKPKVQKPRVKRSTKRKKKKRVAKKKVVPVIKKAENAKNILVVGDFYAGALAKGLQARFAKNPNIIVKSRIKNSSGLVRIKKFDWYSEVPIITEIESPDLILVMLGVNDRQPIRVDEGKLPLRSPEWDQAYQKKVAEFADVLRATNLPYLWMGLPPIKSAKASTDLLFFNETYRASIGGALTGNALSAYVDIWDGFADELGNYVRSGPDESGKLVRLRFNDGINFNRRGRAKLAYYAETEMRKLYPELFFAPNTEGEAIIAKKKPLIDPRTTGRTEIISLNDQTIYAERLIGSKKDFAEFKKQQLKHANINPQSQANSEPISVKITTNQNVAVQKLDKPKQSPKVAPKGLYKADTSPLKRADYFTLK